MVKEIEGITANLGKMLVTIEPETEAEWEAMEKLQAAHKQMRSIEIIDLVEKPARAASTR
jgi:hypothetical protein